MADLHQILDEVNRVAARFDSMVGRRADGLAERVAGARRLYERPGTPGEKEAAREALLRMGVSAEQIESWGTSGTKRAEPPKSSSSRGHTYKDPDDKSFRWIVTVYNSRNRHKLFTYNFSGAFTKTEEEARQKAFDKSVKAWIESVGYNPPCPKLDIVVEKVRAR